MSHIAPIGIYDLKSNPTGRHTGLTRAGYVGRPSLLQTIRIPGKITSETMPPRAVNRTRGKGKQEIAAIDEDIRAPPIDFDDSQSSEDGLSVNILSTAFTNVSEEPQQQQESAGRSGRTAKSKKVTDNTNGAKSSSRRGSGRFAGDKRSTSSSRGSPKRKNHEDQPPNFGGGMVDSFGRVIVKKAKKSTYGSSQRLSQSTTASSRLNKNKLSQGVSRKIFKQPPIIDDTDSDVSLIGESPKPNFKMHQVDAAPLRQDTPEREGFRKPYQLSVEISSPNPRSPVKEFISRTVEDSLDNDDEYKPPIFIMPSKTLDVFSDDKLASNVPLRPLENEPDMDEPLATQLPVFRKFEMPEGLDDDIVHEAQKIASYELPTIPVGLTFDEDFSAMTQSARCPMCNLPVDSDELRVAGHMNTRQQEKFCRSHQKKKAMQDWELNDYPEIGWENLALRIAKHHSFIKALIDGEDCHSRRTLDETVKAGKDRTLLKMTSNLTPGYYGSRGLREISESIMKKFTPLLKKRIVKDRLIAARGVTGFVQSVLVPEVTVLLIMEDMNIDNKQAREVLANSVCIGELVHEEIKDFVDRRVEDSEDDDYDDCDN